MDYTLGIGDLAVGKQNDRLITYALGSCVAICIYDRAHHIGGMVHIALAESRIDPEKAVLLPGYFADTAIPALLTMMKKQGADMRLCWVKLIGGANVLENMHHFDIGRQNILAIRKEFWRLRMGIIKSDVGGKISRTVYFDMPDGKISIKNKSDIWEL